MSTTRTSVSPGVSGRTRGPKAFAVGLAVLAVAGAAAGCSASGASSTSSDQLRIAATFLPTFIDPAKGIDAVFSFVESPTRVDAQGKVRPVLLAKAPTRRGNTEWDLQFRPGVKFQDGHPMDAKAVVAALTRTMGMSSAAKEAIPGAKFTATGPLSVSVTTPKPAPLLPYVLADPTFGIYDASAVKTASDGTCAWAGRGAFTAPYAITACNANQMTLQRFPGYWQGRPALQQIVLTHVPDSLARAAAVESGQADFADSANTPDIVQATQSQHDAQLKLSQVPLTLTRLYFNLTQPVAGDTTVRRAVLAALDYQTLAKSFSGGTGITAQGILPTGYPGAAHNQVYNPAIAAKMLDQADWTMGSDGLRHKDGQTLSLNLLVYNERPEMKPLSLGIQSQLKKVGIGVKIATQPFSYKMYDTQKWDIALYSDYSVGPNAVPDSYLATYLDSHGSENFGHVDDAQLSQMLSKLTTSSGAQRDRLLAGIQRRVVSQDAYQAVLIYAKDGALVGPAWRSYVPDADSYQYSEWNWKTSPDPKTTPSQK
jgi:peptide/nickel transport system substrate-binding protein